MPNKIPGNKLHKCNYNKRLDNYDCSLPSFCLAAYENCPFKIKISISACIKKIKNVLLHVTLIFTASIEQEKCDKFRIHYNGEWDFVATFGVNKATIDIFLVYRFFVLDGPLDTKSYPSLAYNWFWSRSCCVFIDHIVNRYLIFFDANDCEADDNGNINKHKIHIPCAQQMRITIGLQLGWNG